MPVEEPQDQRPQITLLRLQIKAVRGVGDDHQFVRCVRSLQGRRERLRLLDGYRFVARSLQDQERWVVLVGMRAGRGQPVEVSFSWRSGPR